MSRRSTLIAQAQAARSFTPIRSGVLQRTCACGGSAGPTGECAACRRERLLQPRLTVNEPGDRYEQEADRVAEAVLRGSDKRHAADVLQAGSSLQRQARAVDGTPAPPIMHEVLGSRGCPLDAGTRRFMEARFGHDFSRVRVHRDRRAAISAQAVHARAYTVGQDIVFGAGQYAPSTDGGRRLLAHELTHTIQQTGRRPAPFGTSTARSHAQRKTTNADSPELLNDPEVRAAIDQVWDASFGHEPFSSEEEEYGGPPTYKQGAYEGVTYREAYFFIDAAGKPTPVQISALPLDIPGLTIPEGTMGFVHSHPTQKRALLYEEGRGEQAGPALSVDQQAARELGIPVYSVAKKSVLKIWLEDDVLKTATFSRRRLSPS